MDLRLLLVFLLAFAAAGLAAFALISKYQDQLVELFAQYTGRTREQLARTRNPLSTERFTRNQAIAAGLFALLGVALAPGILPRLFLGAVFGGLAWFAADRYLDWQWQRYQREFEEQLPDMVGVVSNAVKSSFSVQQALDLVTAEFADPMGAEVTEVLQEIRMGVPFEEALQNWGERLDNDDLDIFVTALIIQRQTGGNLSEVLENLAATMRERRRIQGQIRTLTTQGRFSGQILTFLPVGLYVVLYLLAPDRMGVLFSDPLGWAIIAVCATMILIGSLIVRRIVTLDV
ncbi:MAG: type II secretion system F family protein [Candidatus Sericytochromatia bacterium]|nr:type II secretion system F family protein [Candidatus Tanganyikabacteria bacterium]